MSLVLRPPFCHFISIVITFLRSVLGGVGLAGNEGAGRRPAGIYVTEVERVELRPQNVALVA